MATNELSFPVEVPAGLQGLELTHNLVQVDEPLGQKALAYTLVLPKSWVTVSNLGEQVGGIGNQVKIGLFAEKVGPGAAVVQVFYTFLPLEVRVRDWIEYQAEKFATRLVSIKDYQFACGPVVDAGGLYGPAENQQVVRLIGHADGARIFLLAAMVAAGRYSLLQRDLTIATNSFKLQHPTGSTQLEHWLNIETLRPPRFQVAYPATWQSREVAGTPPGKSAVDLVLGQDEKLLAYLRVKAIDPALAGDESPEERLQQATAELREAKVDLAGPWKPDPDESLGLLPGVTGAYWSEGKLNKTAVSLRLALVERPPWRFAATLLSVPRTDDTLLWMRSKRAYELALETARPLAT